MRIVSLQLKNFRCFSSLSLDFESPLIIITGANGSGKTSIIEALHFLCYLRSFKTARTKELILTGSKGFSITSSIASENTFDTLQVQFTPTKRSVKLNQKPVNSFKELYSVYKAITITEDDLLIVKGSPSVRRAFIDQMLILKDPSYALILRKYRQIIENRNSLLGNTRLEEDSYYLWTDQLLKQALIIQEERKKLLTLLQETASSLAHEVLDESYTFTLSYEPARPYRNLEATAEELVKQYPAIMNQERAYKRSLIGAHLDDYSIQFQKKSSRIYASRGQQKLIVFLLKLAQLQLIKTEGAVLLIDDFLTDFDDAKVAALLPLIIKLPSQTFITATSVPPFLQELLTSLSTNALLKGGLAPQHISITEKPL
jgi:DNA replication and repair protein RecF